MFAQNLGGEGAKYFFSGPKFLPSIKFLLLGGGGDFGFWGGECRFYFYGREDVSDSRGFSWGSLALIQGSFGPFGPKVAERVRNEFSGPLGTGGPKSLKQSQNF